ncbi:hypothetical protein HMPREF9318_02125 [Streptococcus urinalis FB127-CNA-2]|uniref:Phosphoenolpyruvate-dependent sugar PTS family porter, EIIA 2 n=1 Tax=Streptococcus urinalis 2285-97 TaxID=764291 RepID=G5KID8_9STRE|nr:BglG family transcription antiterminator [Streptococcus urinalis]EHJ56857.1 phosphoenolpyruvate-dependent sugar PTS family porter, EIIA 2 [Streptococcus urinalis 2285-97]EKS17248.1 hypothetical protein HMPREF9318_02125 [Streptococcus urinalis FB127-CNA-2]VEF32502.1 transcriptional regulator [Streptococcus urinalis]
MLGQKEILILQYLYQHKGDFVTSKELAKHLACSDRTVRTYIKSLLSSIEGSSGISILSKQGHGYQLTVNDQNDYLSLIKADSDHFGTENIDINDRRNYIINKLIFEQDDIFFEDLVDTLYVSRSTLSADFKKIRQDFVKYNLSIESRANKGVYVKGAEHDKRHFIMDYYFSGHFLKNIHQYVGDDFFKLPISFEEITIIVLDECRNQSLKLSDFVIQNLIVHIALAISRVNKGFRISELKIDQSRFQKEISIARQILTRTKGITKTDFPNEEINYIAVHLISESAQKSKQDSQNRLSLLQDLVKACLEIDQLYGYQFSQDFTFLEGLLTHLEVLLERLKNDVRLDNPLLQDIQTQYKEAYLIAHGLMSHMITFQDYHLSEDEIAYVSLHLLAAIERFHQNHKLNALVICATGYGSAQMLRMRIENELGRQINVVDLVGYYDITADKLENVDLIISTIDLSNLVFTIPVFTVSVFLNDKEVQTIKQKLNQIEFKQHRPKQSSNTLSLLSTFEHYFDQKRFLILNQSTKEDVLDHLIQMMDDDKNDTDYSESMKELISLRESFSSVVFDQDIAVPHPLKAIDTKAKIAVAIIRDGIYWEEDFESIRLVFLVSPSQFSNEGLSDITRVIVALTEQKEQKEKLIACKDFDDFKSIFLQEI